MKEGKEVSSVFSCGHHAIWHLHQSTCQDSAHNRHYSPPTQNHSAQTYTWLPTKPSIYLMVTERLTEISQKASVSSYWLSAGLIPCPLYPGKLWWHSSLSSCTYLSPSIMIMRVATCTHIGNYALGSLSIFTAAWTRKAGPHCDWQIRKDVWLTQSQKGVANMNAKVSHQTASRTHSAWNSRLCPSNTKRDWAMIYLSVTVCHETPVQILHVYTSCSINKMSEQSKAKQSWPAEDAHSRDGFLHSPVWHVMGCG